MSDKISSKYLNLYILAGLVNSLDENATLNGVMILTSFGLIIGKLFMPIDVNDHPAVGEIIVNQKSKLIDNLENDEPFELIGDGSTCIIKDATIKYSNNSTIKINEITLHCDQIIGFSPINIQDFLSQCNP